MRSRAHLEVYLVGYFSNTQNLLNLHRIHTANNLEGLHRYCLQTSYKKTYWIRLIDIDSWTLYSLQLHRVCWQFIHCYQILKKVLSSRSMGYYTRNTLNQANKPNSWRWELSHSRILASNRRLFLQSLRKTEIRLTFDIKKSKIMSWGSYLSVGYLCVSRSKMTWFVYN